MYKMVLVDDEKYVINGLKKGIDWTKLNIKIVGEARNGVAALELIKKEEPDIVITDIYMPKMDGLELIEKTLEIFPHTKAIILSGYEDFKFAQSAIRKRAFDYILKPIEKDKIINIVDNAVVQIKKELEKIKDMNKLRKQFEENLPILREKFLINILDGTLSLQNILEEHNYLDINLRKNNFVVMAIEIDEDKVGKCEQLITLGIKNIIKKIINEVYQGEVIEEYFKRIIAIINYDECEEPEIVIEKIEKICTKIKNSTNKNFDKLLTVGVGRVYEKSDFIMDSYNESIEALEYKLFLGKGETIFYNDVAITKSNCPSLYPFLEEEKIITALNLGDTENIANYIEKFLQVYTKHNVSPHLLRKACLQLIYVILRKVSEWDISLETIGFQEEVVSSKIRKLDSYLELKEYLAHFLKAIADYNKNKKNESNRSVIEKACSFIKGNYYQDLSLRQIANSVHLTRTYFANLFKKETGKTVIAFLNDTRIKKAKKLLITSDFKIYEIAEKVGYNNSNYFAKVFKKHCGVSPNEYRNISRKE